MATLLSGIITNARYTLNEPTASFWSDAELLTYAVDAVRALWREILDLGEGHFQTKDETNVSLAASATTLTGVPTDVFRVSLLEVRDLTSSASVFNLTFEPKHTNDPDFTAARGLGSVDPNGRIIYYALTGAGGPIAAPTIEVAPKITSAVNLRLIYNPTLAAMTAASNNPIPGESDHAIQAFIIAHARAREREDRSPDPEWMAIFESDKLNLMQALTPRQTQEPETVEALFESYWS